MRRLWRTLGSAALATTITTGVQADLVSPYGGETAPNFVEIDVRDGHVRVALEIDLRDYPLFVEGDASDTTSLAERTGRTLLVAADGFEITPVTRIVDVRPRSPRPTAGRVFAVARERSADVVYAELEYPFDGRPKTLTFTPPLNEQGMPVASLGVLVTHLGVPVTDYRYLSQPEVLRPDWDDPWFTAFENPNLTRHHKSPLMSFISIEPREVRHEILFRARDLDGWDELDLGGSRSLDANDIARVERLAAAFFREHNPIVIDGISREPVASRVQVVTVDVTGLQVVEQREGLDPVTALFGIVLSYPHTVLPQRLEMTWDVFPDGLDAVPAMVTDPAGGVPTRVTPDDPVVAWTNFLKTWEDPTIEPVRIATGRRLDVPLLSAVFLALAGVSAFGVVTRSGRRRWSAVVVVALFIAMATTRVAVLPLTLPDGSVDEFAASQIVSVMAQNAATALLESRPERFDAALVGFVALESIDDVGAEIRRGLAITLPSGARARTDAIETVSVDEITAKDGGIRLVARWTSQVGGGHWGHLHRRGIEYRALMDVVEADDVWKLQGLTILSARSST